MLEGQDNTFVIIFQTKARKLIVFRLRFYQFRHLMEQNKKSMDKLQDNNNKKKFPH